MRREALSEYALACSGASAAAERCAAVTSQASYVLGDLREWRAKVAAAEKVLAVVGDDVMAAEAWDVSPDDPDRDVIATRIRMALDRVSRDLESSEPAIVEAADRIGGLHTLLEQLKPR